MLLRHRATVDVPDHMTGKTALVKAAYVGHTPTAIALLDAKADVNASDSQGYTSLAFATSFNHEYMLQVLLHSDADPNMQDVFGITPLIHAAARGRLDTVQMLLQAGARPLLTDSEGKTAIDYADSAQFPVVSAELRDAAKLVPQSVSAAFGQGSSPVANVPMTPRVPGSADVVKVVHHQNPPVAPRSHALCRSAPVLVAQMTPRVPSGGDMTARRFMAENNGTAPRSPAITVQQLSPLSSQKLSYLSKKLVHLSVMLEQVKPRFTSMDGSEMSASRSVSLTRRP